MEKAAASSAEAPSSLEQSSDPTTCAACFVVTGFGPFLGVRDNPTTVLARNLKQHLQQEQHDRGGPDWASVTTTHVFETSADCVKKDIDSLYDKVVSCSNQNPRVVVFLHLGVNYKGVKYHVEQCAYNDATFRIPDEQGYQPKATCIVKEDSLGARYQTDLDVKLLCEQINKNTSETSSLPPAVVSTDPGRFVCNYAYCYSLNRSLSHNTTAEEENNRTRVRSLFIHVPPFAASPEEEQVKFVMSTVKAIYRQVQKENAIKFDDGTLT